jgi:hypothetical protein
MIIEIFVTQSQSEDSLPNQLFNRMLDAPGITIAVKAGGQAWQEACLLLNFTQQGAPPSLETGPASKRARTSRRNEGAKGKESWIHSVMEGAASSAARTSSMQTRYATESGPFQPPPCEISALILYSASSSPSLR